MSYNPNIPNIGDFLSLSQKQMLANFQSINNSFLVDHEGLTEDDDVGKHNRLTLRPQSADPITAANQCALYNKLVSSVPQLHFRPSSNGTPIQLSNSNLNTIQTGSTKAVQSTFLAGPFTVYMGFLTSCPNGQLVQFTNSTTLIYVGLSTVLLGNVLPSIATTATATNITGNQFNVTFNVGLIPINPLIYYTAVGI